MSHKVAGGQCRRSVSLIIMVTLTHAGHRLWCCSAPVASAGQCGLAVRVGWYRTSFGGGVPAARHPPKHCPYPKAFAACC